MEVWILYGDDIESSADLAFEVRRFLAEGKKMGIDVKVFRPSQFDLLVNDQTRDSILINGKHVSLPDFVYPYFNHKDQSYFSLAVVRQLERQGVRVFNGASTIENVRDKMHTHQVLCENAIPTPITMLAKFPVDIDLIERTIGFPVVVKTLNGALGIGVFLIQNKKAFQDLLELIGETNPDLLLIFQKFVKASEGRDLRLFTVDGEVIAAMERRAKEGDFKANYSSGGSVHFFEPDQEALDIAVKTSKVLNIQIGGIDLLFSENGGYTICEANTFPGFKGLEKASGVNVPEKIFQAMQRRLEQTALPGKETADTLPKTSAEGLAGSVPAE
ncbi:MAG: RimK family alpha-L-glutamate ligase [Rhodospirillales bacterium]|nr:RimK family alpha-L-glutamate ligase [Alphaproteobacteria bacterium]USO03764.1 MAG: RimK family alpha-L-glutamate ligase [Rhodospirillales bacterium]